MPGGAATATATPVKTTLTTRIASALASRLGPLIPDIPAGRG
jgi:hypothetical protein